MHVVPICSSDPWFIHEGGKLFEDTAWHLDNRAAPAGPPLQPWTQATSDPSRRRAAVGRGGTTGLHRSEVSAFTLKEESCGNYNRKELRIKMGLAHGMRVLGHMGGGA